jgi:hypothetical protein
MRYLNVILGTALLSVGLLAVTGQGQAAIPALTPDHSAVADTPVEKVGCYYRRRGYYPYGYYRPYYEPYWYRPYGYYG